MVLRPDLYVAIAMTGGGDIKGFILEHNQAFPLCQQIGMKISTLNNKYIVIGTMYYSPFDITGTYTRAYQLICNLYLLSLATQCKGESIITDSVYNDRFNHISELLRMGATIKVKERSIRIIGREGLSGAIVSWKDFRATTSLVCAGLAASGSSFVFGGEHLRRGHGNLVEKLIRLGANIGYE